MKLATSDIISKTDAYAEEKLKISTYELIERSGMAVADAAEKLCESGHILILAGGGNNGADGYAAAKELRRRGRSAKIIDVFGKGQRTEGGKAHLEECRSLKIEILTGADTDIEKETRNSSLIIDAIFGTGVRLPLPECAVRIARAIGKSPAKKLAVDLPLGVSADSGEAMPCTPYYDMTVELSMTKVGVMSYPARAHTGKIVSSRIFSEREIPDFESVVGFSYFAFDKDEARAALPHRAPDSNKGSFGRCSLIVGSKEYRGAAVLALSSALRSGVGYTELHSEKEICDSLLTVYPEAIYKPRKSLDMLTNIDISTLISDLNKSKCILIGSGCGVSEGLYNLLASLLKSEGAPLVVDADAINALSRHRDEAKTLIGACRRNIVLTPHPLEFSRISGIPLDEISSSRLKAAESFARELGCTVLLKGAATVSTDGERTYINTSGSSALAKAGSGDSLAGLLTGLIASDGGRDATVSAALAAYIHGAAADMLASEYSEYGVTPSDLAQACARIIKSILG